MGHFEQISVMVYSAHNSCSKSARNNWSNMDVFLGPLLLNGSLSAVRYRRQILLLIFSEFINV